MATSRPQSWLTYLNVFSAYFELQVAPVVMVLEQQGAAVGVIGILDFDDRMVAVPTF